MKNRFFLYFSALFLAGCSSTSNTEIEGEWILNSMLYQGKEIYPESYNTKLILNPVPYANKELLTFQSQGKTGIFPGIQSPDILMKWSIVGDSIFIAGDSLFLEEAILKPIEYLKTDALLNQDELKQQKYDYKKDSILAKTGFSAYSKPLDVYTGRYIMEKYDDKVILVSKTTVMELINLELANSAAIDKAFPKR